MRYNYFRIIYTLAGLLFGEVPAIPVFLGGAMILCGVLYYSKIEKEV
jgi:drug/metabolite transporter (DMT)-like permease